MIYLDQRGVCRPSSLKDGNYSMDRMIQDFEEVRETLGIKEWFTLDHSFGWSCYFYSDIKFDLF